MYRAQHAPSLIAMPKPPKIPESVLVVIHTPGLDVLKSGKIEVLCHELIVLNPSITPPFQLDDDNLSETTRLTHRVLDLRRPQMQHNLRLRYRVAIEVRKYLDSLGFIDIETPMLTKSTPEGARDYLVPSRTNAGPVLRAAAIAATVQAAADGR